MFLSSLGRLAPPKKKKQLPALAPVTKLSFNAMLRITCKIFKDCCQAAAPAPAVQLRTAVAVMTLTRRPRGTWRSSMAHCHWELPSPGDEGFKLTIVGD